MTDNELFEMVQSIADDDGYAEWKREAVAWAVEGQPDGLRSVIADAIAVGMELGRVAGRFQAINERVVNVGENA